MRVLIFGATGMLGPKLLQVVAPSCELWGTVRERVTDLAEREILPAERTVFEIEAADEPSIRRALETVKPDIVINAVGIVKQLKTSKDVIKTLSINSIFPHRLAQFAEEFDYRLICLSTDCVFSGERGNYSEDDLPDPVDLYGKSKELGEVGSGRCLTLRTSIIGRELATGHSLVEWFLSNEGKNVDGFTKAIYSGFPTIVLAEIIRSLIFEHRDLQGIYNVSSDPISKYDLLLLLKEFYEARIEIAASDEIKIDRSLNSARFRKAVGFSPLTWREMIEVMASDPTPYRSYK